MILTQDYCCIAEPIIAAADIMPAVNTIMLESIAFNPAHEEPILIVHTVIIKNKMPKKIKITAATIVTAKFPNPLANFLIIPRSKLRKHQNL
jgi:hypothetical protein